MFQIFASKLLELPFLRSQGQSPEEKTNVNVSSDISADDDLDLALYYLRALSNVFKWAPDYLWAVLAKQTISPDFDHPNLSELSKFLIFLL
jgi:hypothetical protein